ncbi:hypothetical protein [Priestia megaterium]|uniref:hypothetical protein n=1 Tax=Priestia megaterium TaxID=1404 RepID=UPI00211C9504|nr:hypothetical protein [Priestia megaterium]
MNQVAFYYRKDLLVIKHGEYKAAVAMTMGDAVKRNETTKELELAATSAEFEGIADKIIFNTQGNDSLAIAADERCRIGVGKDYEFVIKNGTYLDGLAAGTEVGVLNGKFQALDATVTVAVGKVVDVFDSGEKAIRIY